MPRLTSARASGVGNRGRRIPRLGGWEITGGQPAGSPFGVDLEAVARGCGFRKTATVDNLEDFRRVFAEAMADTEAWTIVGKIQAGDSPYRPSKNCVQLRDRFKSALR